jgi:hypothetical protein
LNDFTSSNQEEGNKDSDINDRQENSGKEDDDSYQQIQNRIKQKYGIPNKDVSPDISPERASMSSRYEMLTGKSPSVELLTSSLDDLLKTLKSKFGGRDTNKEGDSSGP